ncbi:MULTISPECIES: hypothetical protein [Catenuloplanes]|uniref:Flp pilus assembly protein TadB n=1 Tax=Catenuloplanes niger TaxID=587534 RepID=A0AAE3ZJ54_9ACTN|nr:hypothetical protein [Catenuloplanes niger]MDR7319967.1 Flp pilus assembly protein TadB [Catenuloplanes niger]
MRDLGERGGVVMNETAVVSRGRSAIRWFLGASAVAIAAVPVKVAVLALVLGPAYVDPSYVTDSIVFGAIVEAMFYLPPTLVILGIAAPFVSRLGAATWFQTTCAVALAAVAVLSLVLLLRPEYWLIVALGQVAVAACALAWMPGARPHRSGGPARPAAA